MVDPSMQLRYRSKHVGLVGALLVIQTPLSSARAAPDAEAATSPPDVSSVEPIEELGTTETDNPASPNADDGPLNADEPLDADEPAPADERASSDKPEPPPEGEPAGASAAPEPAASTETSSATAPLKPPRLPRHRLIYNNLTGFRYNPLGLSNELSIGYRYQLINRDTILFRESFISAQAHTVVTPAYVGAGPRIEVQPAVVLNLSATYDYVRFFGAFGSLQSFPSANAQWHDDVISDLADKDLNYGAGGHQITLSALLQGKVKNVAIRDNPKLYWYDFDLRNGDRTYYNQTIDILVPGRGWAMTNDLDLLYLFDFGLTLGARYTVTQAFYRDEHFAPGEETTNINGPTHRVGPALIYSFYDRPDQRFNQPSLVVLAQWWAKHPYRTGREVSGAIPYFVVAFTFKGDIHPHPATWNPKSERRKKTRRPRRAHEGAR